MSHFPEDDTGTQDLEAMRSMSLGHTDAKLPPFVFENSNAFFLHSITPELQKPALYSVLSLPLSLATGLTLQMGNSVEKPEASWGAVALRMSHYL